MSNYGRLALATFVAAALSLSCGSPTTSDSRVAASITLSATNFSLDDGSSQTLQATVFDQHGQAFSTLPSGQAVSWTSADPSIATVDAGVVRGIRPGQTSISASVGTVSISTQVTVRQVATALVDLDQGTSRDGYTGQVMPAIRVRLTDRHGTAVPNAELTFTVTSGGGTVSPASGRTDADGSLQATWTYGTTPGQQKVEVRATAFPAVPLLTISGMAQSSATQLAFKTSPTSGTAGAVLSAVVIEVHDAAGQLAPSSASITLSLAEMPDGATAGGTLTRQATSGIASFGDLVLTKAGTYRLGASSAGLTGATSDAFVVNAAAAASAERAAGDGQTQQVGQPVAIRPAVRVVDGFGNPVPNIKVTFAVTAGGGTLTGATPVTDATGIATVGSWTLGPAEGVNTLTATVDGQGITGSPLTFSATSTSTAPHVMTRLSVESQTGVVKQAAGASPSVKITQDGQPVAGATVTFAITAGGGTVAGNSTQQITTGTDGIATAGAWVLGSVPGTNTLEARADGTSGSPMPFTATASAGPPAAVTKKDGDAQSAITGSAVTIAPAVLVKDALGNPVAHVNVTWAVASGGGSIVGPSVVATGDDGISRVGGWQLGAAAGTNSLTATVAGSDISGNPATFSATATAPATVGSVVIASGDGQTAAAGYPVAQPLVAKVLDGQSQPMAGVSVTWAVTSGGGSVDAAQSVTGPDGLASVNWTLGPVAGVQGVTATAGSKSVSFSGTSQLLKASSVQFTPNVLSMGMFGDSQEAVVTVFDNSVPSRVVYGVPVDIELNNDVADLEVVTSTTVASLSPARMTAAGQRPLRVLVPLGKGAPKSRVTRSVPTRVLSPNSPPNLLVALSGVRSGDRIRIRGKAQGQSGVDVFDASTPDRPQLTDNVDFLNVLDPLDSVKLPHASPITVFEGDTIHIIPLTYDSLQRLLPYSWFGGRRSFHWYADNAAGQVSLSTTTSSDCDFAEPNCTTKDSSIAVTGVTAGTLQLHVETGRTSGGSQVFDRTDSVSVLVVRPKVVAVNLSPANPTVGVGHTLQLTATVMGENGKPLTDREVAWQSLTPAVATVDPYYGTVTPVAPGTSVIVATSEGVEGRTTVTVASPVASIVVSPNPADVSLGGKITLSAVAHDASGAVRPALISWASGDAKVTVDPNTGVVTPVVAGNTTVSASSEGVSGSTTVRVPTLTFSKLVSGECVLNDASTLYCWNYQQFPQPVASGHTFTTVVGDGSWCGNEASGATLCWGANNRGQLGDGTTIDHADPRPVSGNYRFRTLASSGEGVCGVTDDGALYCWGNLYDFGTGSGIEFHDDLTPVRTGPTDVVFTTVAIEPTHACATTSTLDLYCWGANGADLGHRPDAQSYADDRVPHRVQLFPDDGYHPVSSVTVGSGFTCVLSEIVDPSTGGAVGCMGSNEYGQLGNPTCSVFSSPCDFAWVTTTLRFTSLSADGGTVCGVTTDSRVACWGYNQEMQAGDGSRQNVTSPHIVPTAGPALAVMTGFNHACVLISEPEVFCWGDVRYSGIFPQPTSSDYFYTAIPTAVASQP